MNRRRLRQKARAQVRNQQRHAENVAAYHSTLTSFKLVGGNHEQRICHGLADPEVARRQLMFAGPCDRSLVTAIYSKTNGPRGIPQRGPRAVGLCFHEETIAVEATETFLKDSPLDDPQFIAYALSIVCEDSRKQRKRNRGKKLAA